MSTHRGTLEELRAAAFAAKEERRRVDAAASPEDKLLMLETMQELTLELKRARATLDVPSRTTRVTGTTSSEETAGTGEEDARGAAPDPSASDQDG